MASAFVHRIGNIASTVALCAIGTAIPAFDFGITQSMPEARAAAERQLNKELARESRFACEKWGTRAGTEEHAACIADVKALRAKHEKRRADDPGNRRDGLAVVL